MQDISTDDVRARALIQTIKSYWAERGYSVRLWTVAMSAGNHGSVIGVRSDMVNGKPIRKGNGYGTAS